MMKAKDIMTTEVVTIRGSATVAEAVERLKTNGLRALIVDRRHEDDPYGIVTEADIVYKVVAHGRNPKQVRVYEIMTKPCIMVNPDLGVEYVARLFASTGLHRAPVVQGGLLGIISLTDILHKSDFVEKPKRISIADEIEAAIEDARAVCIEKGIQSKDCAAAWDIVEELQAEASHRREKAAKTAFQQYCEEFPDAPEARMYDD